MADLADVMDLLEAMAISAVFPNGTGQPSVTLKAVDIAQGWPLPGDVDAAMAAGSSIVSIYAVPGTSSDPGQVFDWQPGAVQAAATGLTAEVDGDVATFAGAPVVGTNVVVTLRGVITSYSTLVGDTAASVALALAVQIAGAQASGQVLTVSGSALAVEIGGSGQLGERIFRQRMQFLIVVWAPNPADRSVLAAPIDVALKRNVTALLPDTSEAIIVHQGTRLSDKNENEGSYRRDLIFFVTWDTIDTYPATEIVAPQASFNAP